MDAGYWDQVYRAKSEREVSWFQEVPTRSLELIEELNLAPGDPIIDIGGGDSRLVDHLLQKGYRNLSVLDISAAALERAKTRLADNAHLVNFIASDVTQFTPPTKYKLWHDRATLHFLTKAEEVETYLRIANDAISPGGYLIVSTFSKSGPEKCSGLPIVQYADVDLKKLFAKNFTNLKCLEDTHSTPWGSTQDFVYCGFKKS